MGSKWKRKVEKKCHSTHNILVLTGVVNARIWKCLVEQLIDD